MNERKKAGKGVSSHLKRVKQRASQVKVLKQRANKVS